MPGDYDGNNTVDGNDFLVYQREFGKTNSPADGNKNGVVDSADYVIWRKYFGHYCVPNPLPTTMVESIDRLVQGKPAPTADNFKLFQSYTASQGKADLQAVHNPSNWGRDINLSPIAWHDTATWIQGDPPYTAGPTLGRCVAITKRHCITHHQHGTESPGSTLQFVRQNGETITRGTDWRYEIAPPDTKLWRILYLTEDLPDDMVAKFPTKDSEIRGKPIAVFGGGYGPLMLYLNWVNPQTSNYSSVVVNASIDPDPVRQKYKGGGIGGDSGKPLIAIIGNEIVPVSVWWYPSGGSSMVYDHDAIIAAIDRLSVTVGDTRMLKPKEIKLQ